MIKQIDNLAWFKLNALLRQFIVRGGMNLFSSHYLVNEFPKSGGSWLGLMLAEALGLPFPRNRLPNFNNAIMHGHYLNTWNISNSVLLWRDGRDVLVSQYYHSLFKNDKGNERLVDLTRKKFQVTDFNDIELNLPKFIEYTYQQKVFPRFNWCDFVEQWSDKPVVHAKYEDLRINTLSELRRIIKELTSMDLDIQDARQIVEQYSFEVMSGRKVGEEDKKSFLRKGLVGDWRNYFNQEAREVFDQYAGEALITLDYEKDHQWVYDQN